MANLVDTSVNGDLRVTGTMFGTQAGNYATCATAAGTAAKAVTISGFTLTTGIHAFVKFTVTNTAAVASLTLNVSGTGAKAMKYRGGNLPAVGTLSASRVYEFIYDGTNWELVGDLDTNTQTVTGVKGNAESSYRTGQVNITPANIGVAATTTSVTVGSTTANIPQATATTPKMDGTAAVGSETTWAKGDHVHPTDTSRVPTTRKVNGHALSADVTVTAADVSAVRYDTNAQGLTDTQKSNARTNIGAGTSNLTLGTTSTTAAKGDHTHTTSIASDSSSGTVVTLAHNTQYKLTAGGTSVLFKTPADSNTDTKVTQTADNSSTGTGFEVLFSATADNTTRTEASRKSNKLTFQPSTGTLTATKFSGPLTGNVTGNCSGSSGSCTGNSATATSAGKLTTARKAYVTLGTASTTTTVDWSADPTTIPVNGTLGVGNGGTGKTSAKDACNSFINALDTGSSTPVDADYYVSQYVSGGTTTTTYHRRPMSALWTYIKGKLTSVSGVNISGNAATATKINTSAKIGDTNKPVYIAADGTVTAISYTIATSVPSGAVFTDTKVTTSANHYTPKTASGSDKTASASGGTAAWSLDVVKGVTINTDGKGHITGLSVTSGKLPSNPNTDTKQRIVASDSKTYLTGVTTAPTSSNQDLTGVANTNVYATAGKLHATTFDVNSKCTLQFNSTTNALDFVFA